MIRDIVDYTGAVLGQIEFKDGTPDDIIAAKLAEYALPPPPPPPVLTLIESLENSSTAYISFGTGLYETMVKKTWALNTYLKIQGNPLTTQQMQILLSSSDMLQKCLQTGSLLTAQDVINSMMSSLPQYADIGNYAIGSINLFLTGGS